ncbi:MAG: hypothetical protein M9916_07245 [Crocinitomicaceae bacterium]|nr:hypothetical protein [Crocinitomicaceae bacterium]
MKKILIIGLLILFGCGKENAKKEYVLSLHFDSGFVKEISCFLYEKGGKYSTNSSDVHMSSIATYIYLRNDNLNEESIKLELVLTEAKFIACLDRVWINCNNASFASGQNVRLYGLLEMYGKYERKGKKVIVNDGSFSIYWYNANDFGEQPQLLEGSWTLKRK